MNLNKTLLLLTLFCAFLIAPSAHSQSSLTEVSISGTGLTGTASLQLFDPSLGTLEGVFISESLTMPVNYSLSNPNTSPAYFNPNPFDVEDGGDFCAITGFPQDSLFFNIPSYSFSAPDTNILVPAGGGMGLYGYIYGTATGSYTIAASGTVEASDSELAQFIGTDTINLTYVNSIPGGAFGSPDSLNGELSPVSAGTSFEMDFTYLYLPTATPEPSTTSLLAVSGGIFIFYIRLKKFKQGKGLRPAPTP